MGLKECDAFTADPGRNRRLRRPAGVERDRARLQDAMVDCEFQLGGARVAVAADADLLAALVRFLTEWAPKWSRPSRRHGRIISGMPIESVVIGDLEDLEWLAREQALK